MLWTILGIIRSGAKKASVLASVCFEFCGSSRFSGDGFGFAAWPHTRVSFKISVCSLCFSACSDVLSALAPSPHRPGNWMHMQERSSVGVEKLEMLQIYPKSEMFISLSCSVFVICLFKSTHVVCLSNFTEWRNHEQRSALCIYNRRPPQPECREKRS